MKRKRYVLILALLATSLLLPARAQEKKKGAGKASAEDDYYKLLRFDLPPGEVMEAGAIQAMPDRKIAGGTPRGEIWMIDNAYAHDPKQAKISPFAPGPPEELGP